MFQMYDFHAGGPYRKRKMNTWPGLQGTVITVCWGLPLTSIHSRLSFQKGHHCKEGLCLLLIWQFLYSLFFASALLSFLCDTAGGGNMTPAAQPGSGPVGLGLSRLYPAPLLRG